VNFLTKSLFLSGRTLLNRPGPFSKENVLFRSASRSVRAKRNQQLTFGW